MTDLVKKNKNIKNTIPIEEYINILNTKCEQNIFFSKNSSKINDENIILPTIQNHNLILEYNYNANQLKSFAKHYKLKIGGNKKELKNRIYLFLYYSFFIIKIQKVFRGILRRKYNRLHGPAYKNRNLCTNNCDFITMEQLNEISLDQFISYKDTDNFIYGFDINSIYNLIYKHKEIKNPYNRNIIPDFVLKDIKTIIRLGKILNIIINLTIEDDTINISSEKAIELRTLTLFQNIDALGNYSNPQWFLDLNRLKLVKFIRELTDIWEYRAQLTIETKKLICPPHGTPFRNLHGVAINNEQPLNSLRNIILDILEKMVNSGVDADSKSLGAYYVLAALTLVNETAANALPWLFQSVS
jgi:hypothetical protein